ncbi:MAG TPA: 2-oxoglutarate dehydrogenase E1 component, partial [Candidatus Methylomirabilis sp.]
DQFLVSARAKWGQTPSLVLLLPHGHEGHGPDHSSARPERFLQLCAELNLRLVNCTTAAQYFHLLRRQAALLASDPLPLVVLTPKSLLRHPRAASPLRDLTGSRWRPLLDDPETGARHERAETLLFCSGKVAVDLLESPQRVERATVAVARLEQVAPFPADEVQALLDAYPHLRRLVWVQEEPENMGAWTWLQPQLARLCRGGVILQVVARPPSSSPAEGSASRHAATQQALVAAAFALEPPRRR